LLAKAESRFTVSQKFQAWEAMGAKEVPDLLRPLTVVLEEAAEKEVASQWRPQRSRLLKKPASKSHVSL
jgi:hypothetical protein